MTITLPAVPRLKVDGILACKRTRGKVEFLTVQGLRDRIFSPAEKKAAAAPGGMPGVYQVAMINSMPQLELELSAPEAEALLKSLEEFEQNEKGPGITAEDGEWFYPLVDAISKKGENK